MSFSNVAKWINLGLDVANSGASIYGTVKMSEAAANAQNPQIYTPSTTVVNKTKEEIALEREKFEAARKRNEANDAFTRAMIFNKYVDTMPKKKDHTTLFIAGGVAILLIAASVITTKNNKNK